MEGKGVKRWCLAECTCDLQDVSSQPVMPFHSSNPLGRPTRTSSLLRMIRLLVETFSAYHISVRPYPLNWQRSDKRDGQPGSHSCNSKVATRLFNTSGRQSESTKDRACFYSSSTHLKSDWFVFVVKFHCFFAPGKLFLWRYGELKSLES